MFVGTVIFINELKKDFDKNCINTQKLKIAKLIKIYALIYGNCVKKFLLEIKVTEIYLQV